MKASIALDELGNLKQRLTGRQLQRRELAFTEVQTWVELVRNQGGVDAPISRSFRNSPRPKDYPDARVDIEVITGKAFVP